MTTITQAGRLAGILLATAAIAAIAAIAVVAGSASAQAANEASRAGEGEFKAYCGSCHGPDGRGNGPVANLLSVKPADLTRLSAANDGNFPFRRVYDTIDGQTGTKVHGSREMPLWGDRFREVAGDNPAAAAEVRGRIFSIILYLESIQR